MDVMTFMRGMDRAVLLDGGDIFQGNTLSNLLDGRPLAEAYQLMGYDAVTIGNHEFDWQIENTVDPALIKDIFSSARWID